MHDGHDAICKNKFTPSRMAFGACIHTASFEAAVTVRSLAVHFVVLVEI